MKKCKVIYLLPTLLKIESFYTNTLNDGIYLPYGYSEFNYDFILFIHRLNQMGKYYLKNALKKTTSYIHSISNGKRENPVSRYNADPRRYAIFNIIVKADNQDPILSGIQIKVQISI